MDALWNVEDKLNISTRQAITALIFTVILAVVLCFITILMVLKSEKLAQRSNQISSHDSSSSDEELESSLMTESKGLKGPGCWCGPRKWGGNIDDVVMRSKYCWLKFSASANKLPVWQRPILMGEKCQLPGFSGLILYDDRGRPLPHRQNRVHSADVDSCNQVEPEVGRATQLKDLL